MEEKKNEKPAEEKKVEAKVNEPNKEVKAGTKKEEPKKVEALPEDDFMINDFNDTDYISFNDLLEGTTK